MMIVVIFTITIMLLSLAIISTNRTELTSFRGTEKLKQLISDYAICDKFGMNKVLPRHDHNNHEFEIDRKWSMLSNALALFSGMDNPRQLSHCESMSELLVAVSQDVKWQGCLVPWMDAAGICEVLSRYRRLFIIGDSLMRQTIAGLLMLIFEDFRFGAMMRPSTSSLSNADTANLREQRRNCSCDGQFSEDLHCRGAILEISPLSRGYCNQFDVPNSFIAYGGDKEIDFARHLCDTKRTPSEDGKPIFIALSHGIHYGFNASKIVDVFLEKQFINILIASKRCPQQVKPEDFRIVVIGGSASSRELAKTYYLQAMDRVVTFNEEIKKYVEAKRMTFKNIFFVDIFNLTLEAVENRTSDGLHLLSDLNAIRAMILVNVMDFTLRNPI